VAGRLGGTLASGRNVSIVVRVTRHLEAGRCAGDGPPCARRAPDRSLDAIRSDVCRLTCRVGLMQEGSDGLPEQ
jgi:hypothetical protein